MKTILISIILLVFCSAVFIFGNPYFRVFPTNGSQNFYIGMTVFFLIGAMLLKRSPVYAEYWRTAYAFFIASAALLFLSTGVLNLHKNSMPPLQNLALDKFSQFLHIVPVIIVLTLISGAKLDSIFIQVGNLKRGLIFGLLSFAGFTGLFLLLGMQTSGYFSSLGKALPLILLLIFSNAIMEELWFRGIFLNNFVPLVGKTAAILITAFIFGTSHIKATYEFPGGPLVFGGIVFLLGVVGAYAMLKDDSLIGPVLFHAGYDLLVIIPVLNS
jgi:membrane protease YdiL (CAAX protease family)